MKIPALSIHYLSNFIHLTGIWQSRTFPVLSTPNRALQERQIYIFSRKLRICWLTLNQCPQNLYHSRSQFPPSIFPHHSRLSWYRYLCKVSAEGKLTCTPFHYKQYSGNFGNKSYKLRRQIRPMWIETDQLTRLIYAKVFTRFLLSLGKWPCISSNIIPRCNLLQIWANTVCWKLALMSLALGNTASGSRSDGIQFNGNVVIKR